MAETIFDETHLPVGEWEMNIEGQKSLYMQLKDADEDIRKMTPDEWPDKLLDNMKPLDPEYSKVVDDHFWELA